MITLGTGLPGNGKTLFMLRYIRDKAEAENRPVFFHGIDIIEVPSTLPWTPFKAEEWPDLPDGSIVVIDEAQFVFPRKPNGAQLPEHYEKLAVHRHKGLDIYLITQHPTLLDNFVRKLVGQHFHSVRKFGLERATIYEWSRAEPAPENASAQKSAVSKSWSFDKTVYGWYKSAEVHTVKKKIPAKIFMVGIMVVAVITGMVMFVSSYGSRGQTDANNTNSTAPGEVASEGGTVAGPKGDKDFDPVADAQHYAWSNTPRVSGLAYTAPKYDEITTPVRAPVPAACLQVGTVASGKVRCKCYSQQGTPLDVEFNMCIEFARNGYFQDFDADKDRQQSQRASDSVQVLASRPDAPVQRERVAPGVDSPVALAFADTPSRLTGANPPPNLNDGPPRERPSRTVSEADWGSVR